MAAEQYLTIVYNSVVSANFVVSVVDEGNTYTLTPSDFIEQKTSSTTNYFHQFYTLENATFTITEDGYQTKTFTQPSRDFDITIEMEEIVSITCTRDSTQDVIGHASQIDANTLYNITDDTDVSLTILEMLYPVGSVYITTESSCPLAMLISGSSWQIISSGVVTSLASTAAVKGNGMTLGLTDGTNNFGMATGYSGSANFSTLQNAFYGSNIGTAGSTAVTGGNKSFGVTTDPEKSGIVADLSSAAITLQVNMFRRVS